MSDIKLNDIPEWSEEEQRKADEARKKQRELENLLMEDYINEFTPREQAIIDIVIERMTRNLSDVEEYIADIRYYLDEMYGAVSNAEDSASYANSNSDDMVEHVDEELEARELKKRLKDLENETKDPSHE
tara:strand:- start:534 stop:923 length:390 start_codon:yes stop_codon:yes gene_type:complete